jgi:hypothetical protein
MEELLIHLARVIYKSPTTSSEDKETITELVKAMRSTGKRFVPPTVEEVTTYLKENNYAYPGRYADEFVSFYEAKGWMIGKNKMKNWKMATKQWKAWEKKNKIIV